MHLGRIPAAAFLIIPAFLGIAAEGATRKLCAQYMTVQCQPPVIYGKYRDSFGVEHETSFDEDMGFNGWVERAVSISPHYFSGRPTSWCAPSHVYSGSSGYADPGHAMHEGWDEHWEHAWIELQQLYVQCGRNPPSIC